MNIKKTKNKHFEKVLDIAYGMLFLHTLNPPLMHRDFKSPNIMVCISPSILAYFQYLLPITNG